jgi:hypothetical protein
MSKLTPIKQAFQNIAKRLNRWKMQGEKKGLTFPNFPSLSQPKRIAKNYLNKLQNSLPKTRKAFFEQEDNFSTKKTQSTEEVVHSRSSASASLPQQKMHSRSGSDSVKQGTTKSTSNKSAQPKEKTTKKRVPSKPKPTDNKPKLTDGNKPKRTRGKDKKPRKKRAPNEQKTTDENKPKRTRGKDKKPRKKRAPNKAKATTTTGSTVDVGGAEIVTRDSVDIIQLAVEYLANLLSEVSSGVNENTMRALSALIDEVIQDLVNSENWETIDIENEENVSSEDTNIEVEKAQAIVSNYEANKSTIIEALQVALYHSESEKIYREGDLAFFDAIFSSAGVYVQRDIFFAAADIDGSGKIYSTETGDYIY